jgi:glycosyltransferase involved in cell wall biosynthesis
MKIGIYLPYVGRTFGGAEQSGVTLAGALSRDHEVEIVHHDSLAVGELARFLGADLRGVRTRSVARPEPSDLASRVPWTRLKGVADRDAELSAPYDVFVAFVISAPPFCHAPRGLLRVVFPISARPGSRNGHHVPGPWFRRGLRRAYYAWEWRQRLAGYQVRLANSLFTRKWAKRRWGVDCDVLHSPADTSICPLEKHNVILSVGRFFTTGHSKKQVEMVLAFRQMLADSGAAGWEYVCAGGLQERNPLDRAYFQRVREAAQGSPVHVLANVPRDELKGLYAKAKIFWHAAGLGEDEHSAPELAEHFGITTVEAMAGGCVPVVIRKGGQPEIVEHGVSGFLWDTIGELHTYTQRLLSDETLRARMSAAAFTRAQRFSRGRFVEEMRRRLHFVPS